jgi:prepilin-type N-terminal cleavage/methylation domain-containing protein
VSLKRARGVTLAELLVVLAILGIVAVAAVPMLMVNETRLDAAGQEVGNALRFAVNEVRRTGSYVLVDAETRPGRLLVIKSNAAAARGGDIVDPLTKRAMDIAVTDSAFSTGVQMSASFIAPSGTFSQLLIGPGPAFWAAQSSVVKGTLQPGSGIVLAAASRTVTIGFDSVTGRVVIP